jgi:Tfp pilus assembly protein PilF
LRLAEEVRLARLDASKDPQLTDALETAIREQERVRLEILQARAKREPDNGEVLYQLGEQLMSVQRLREAIAAFRQAQIDPRYTSAAAFAAGECHEQDGNSAEALRLYRVAAEGVPGAQQHEFRIRALQRASRLAEKLKLPALAQYYQQTQQALERT